MEAGVRHFVLGAALLLAPGALAQEYPVVVGGGTYAPLGDAGAPVPGVTGTYAGAGTIDLNGWTFPYFDAGYDQVTVTTDGYLIVGNGLLGGCTPDAGICGTSFPCPSAQGSSFGCCGDSTGCATQNGFAACCVISGTFPPFSQTSFLQVGPSVDAEGTIAGWWETLDDTGVSGISYAQGGAAGSHYLTVDYHGVPTSDISFGEGSYYSFSITLTESGLVQVAYGTMSTPANNFPDTSVAWASLEDPAGTTWVTGLGCESDGGCTGGGGDFPSNTDITYGSPPGVYLSPESITAGSGALDAGSLSFDVNAEAADLGLTPVDAGFPYNAYLVQSLVPTAQLPACPGGASCLGVFAVPSGIAAKGSEPISTGTLAVPYPLAGGAGTYYVELWLDPANVTGNTSQAVGLSQPLIVGVDLAGSVNVTADGGAVPDNGSFPLPITLENTGLLAADGVEYQLWLTAGNQSIDTTTDFEVEDTTVTLAGGQTINRSDTAQTHDAAQGTYYVAMSIDPNHLSGNLNPT